MKSTMVKKRFADGHTCKKCVQAQEMLERRGLWQKVDRVVLAVEDDASSEGMRLAAQHAVDNAPFFIIEHPGGKPEVFTSVVHFAKALVKATKAASAVVAAGEEPTQAESVDAESMEPEELVRDALSTYGADCAISFSGAEDVVLIDMASKVGLPFAVFSLDTGRLHAETYRFIERVRKHYGVEIELFSPDAHQLQPFVRKKGLFSFLEDGHKECCKLRKIEPLRRALSSRRAWITGQRKDQSVTRVELAKRHTDGVFTAAAGPLIKYNPLADWSSAQVWAYIRDQEVPYNELHERGYVSIGCEPCTRAINPGEHERAGRWWWELETQRECGLHVAESPPV